MCHVGSLPALFWSERKKKKKKRQYVLHYVPVLAGISQKCKRLKLYLHTSSSNSRHCSNVVIVVEGDLSHNLPALYQLLSAWALTSFYQLLPYPPPFPLCAALSRANRTEKKKKKMLKRLLCLLTPSPDLPPTHPPTPSLPSFKLLTLQRLFLLSRKTTMVVSSFFVIFLLASVLFFVSRLCLCGCYSYGHHPSFLRFVFFFLFLFVWF